MEWDPGYRQWELLGKATKKEAGPDYLAHNHDPADCKPQWAIPPKNIFTANFNEFSYMQWCI